MPRLALWVRCGACDRVFDTGIRMDRRNFARATLATNYHTCPACGQRGTYHKDHYIVRDDAPDRDRSADGRNEPAAGQRGACADGPDASASGPGPR